MERGDFADIVLEDEVVDFLRFVVFVAEDLGIKISVDFFEFAFAQFLDDLVLFLPQNRKVAILGFSFKLSEMFFMEAKACERVLNFLNFAIGSERQKLVYLLSVEILSYDIHVQHRRKVL